MYVHSPVFFHVDLFDLVSTTQNLAHNTQQIVEFLLSSLAVIISSNEELQLD